MPEKRTLRDLAGIGKKMAEDFHLLGIHSVEQLTTFEGRELYDKLCVLTRTRQDSCVLDAFVCAVAQARNPRLLAEQRDWWYWSRKRKATAKGKTK